LSARITARFPLERDGLAGQFEHPLVRRAKCEIARPRSRTASCPRTTSPRARQSAAVFADARRARDEFGYLRMWSIHPSQIDPIVERCARAPRVEKAQTIIRGAGRRVGTAAHRRRAARSRVVPAGVDDLAARARRGRPLDAARAAYFQAARPVGTSISRKTSCASPSRSSPLRRPRIAQDYPEAQAGQWDDDQHDQGATGARRTKSTMCIDDALQTRDDHDGRRHAREMCTKNEFKRDGAQLRRQLECKIGESKIVSRTVMTLPATPRITPRSTPRTTRRSWA
jgi:hypothetical protein